MTSNILTICLNPAVDLSGEADVVQHTRKVRTSSDRFDPGGGGINVARIVARFGGEAEVVFLAGGEMGALLERLVKEKGVPCQSIRMAGQTRVSYSVRERNTGHEYRFVAQGPEITNEEIQPCLDLLASHEASYVVASGSLPAGCPTDVYARMAELSAKRGVRFVLDSSGEGLRATLEAARVFLIKPSIGELEQLVGKRLDEHGVRKAAADIVERGVAELVAVTMGAEGALLASAEGVLRIPAIHVSERSAVGAGDSFLGAMVWALADGWSTVEAFRFGVAAGAAAVMTPGTEMCRREDTLELYRRMGAHR